jgi:uncharacterized Zn finger protein (UPF0148 family)
MQEETKEIICPKCKIPMEGGVCPVCDMRAIDIEDEDEYNDRRERR